jgi:hypothetical protein
VEDQNEIGEDAGHDHVLTTKGESWDDRRIDGVDFDGSEHADKA